MGLTYRNTLGRALTTTEIDDNFRYFTGSHGITGSLKITGDLNVSGSITGNIEVTSSLAISASHAVYSDTASFIAGGVESSSYAETASFLAGGVESSSYAETASFALNVALAPAQVGVTASLTSITGSTTILSYGKVNLIDATATDYAVRLPEPRLGGVVNAVNKSSVDVRVFPYDSASAINGLNDGEHFLMYADNSMYTFTCVQNPSVGVWSVATPLSNNGVRRSVSVNLVADGTYNDGANYSYSAPLLNASKTTYYPSTGAYDVLDAPLSTNDWFDSPEFNTYNKVRISKITAKTNVPAGDLTGAASQISSTLMGITGLQLFQLFGYVRIVGLESNGATFTLNEYNQLRPLNTYSALVNAGNSTSYASSYMKNGTLYQQLEGTPSSNVWQDINDANGNRRIYYSPYIGYGQPGTPYTGYPADFEFEAELIVEFEFIN